MLCKYTWHLIGQIYVTLGHIHFTPKSLSACLCTLQWTLNAEPFKRNCGFLGSQEHLRVPGDWFGRSWSCWRVCLLFYWTHYFTDVSILARELWGSNLEQAVQRKLNSTFEVNVFSVFSGSWWGGGAELLSRKGTGLSRLLQFYGLAAFWGTIMLSWGGGQEG